MSQTTTATLINPLFSVLKKRGIEGNELCRKLGINVMSDNSKHPADNQNQSRNSVDDMHLLWEASAQTCDNEAIGLEVAEEAIATTLFPAIIAVQSSASLMAAVEKAKLYTAHISNGVTMDYQFTENLLLYVDECITDEANRPSKFGVDMFCASAVLASRRITGRDAVPVRVTLRREAPSQLKKFKDFFQCPIQFGADRNIIEMPYQNPSAPLPNSNQDIAHYFDRMIAEDLASFASNNFLQNLQNAIINSLHGEAPKIEQLAQTFNLSARSLQRRLSDYDTSFTQEVETARSKLARYYLERTQLSIGEITYALGFATESNFIRAFKRWHQSTPKQFREAATQRIS